jgi:AmmeMemoRadiSam system protein A
MPKLAALNQPAKADGKGLVLIATARAEIARALGVPHQPVVESGAYLQQNGASFVTLTQHDKLRGCIGSIEAYRSLLLDVKANALAAAFRDPRFPVLTKAELAETDIEVSLLSAMQAINFASEADALEQLRCDVDGVVLEFRHYRSTFMPQVWQQLADKQTFLAHLKHKAGLPADFWHEELKLMRYTVIKYKENNLQSAVKVSTND